MAYGSSNPGGGEDYMSDSSAEAPASARDMEKKPEESMGETTIVPKSICPGMEFKVGEEMVLRVKRILDTDYEMEYAPEPKHDDATEPPHDEAAEGGEGGGEMRSMMSDY